MRKFIFFFSFTLVFTSCVSHLGLVSNNNQNQTSVQLNTDNFVVVKNVTGQSHANYFLGIGGFNDQGLIAQARGEMIRKADLVGSSRALINENLEYQSKMIFPFVQIKVLTSASVVEFFSQKNESDSIKEQLSNLVTDPIDDSENLDEIKPKFVNGLFAGLRMTPFGDRGSVYTGLKTEISWPGMSKQFFLEPQFNVDYSPYPGQVNFYVPLYAGIKTKFAHKTSFFAKAGFILNYDVTSSFLETPGLGIATGLEFNNKFQGVIGYDIYASEYISGPKIGFVYLF